MEVQLEHPAEEIKRLQRCLNDLVSVIALPAVWTGGEPVEIVRALCEALLGMLSLDLVYVRLGVAINGASIEMVRFAQTGSLTDEPREIGELFERRMGDDPQQWPPLARHTVGDADMTLVPLRLGLQGEIGVIVAGSRRADFPRQTEGLVLSVAVNQAAIGLQEARLLSEQKRVAGELDRRVAQRTAELAAANEELKKEVAERKRAEAQRDRNIEELQAKQELLDLAQKSAGAMAFDWHIQEEINYWSPEQEALFGLAPGTFDGTYRTWKKMMYAPDWPTVVAAIEHAHQTGKVTAEYRVVWPDGSLHWLSTNGRMFFDEEGMPLRMVGFTSNVTRRKLVEEELRRSEAFLAEGQHLARMGNFSWRVAPEEIIWSEQLYRIFEFEPGVPMTLELMATRIHPEDVGLLHDMVDRAQRGVSDFEYEHRLLMPDNSIKHLRLIAHGTRDDQGRLEYIGAGQDVTQRRLSEEALNEARSELARVARSMSLGVLTASIAHEVNQPLSGIITNASTCVRMLDADPPNVDGARETARRTIRDGHRAADVIKRLRALFGKKDATTEPVDLNEAAREVIALSLSELQRGRVILQTELTDDLPPVTGDRVQLQQVVLNLLLNASDAMSGVDDRPRKLVIRTERDEGDCVRLSVQDTGVGFDPQDLGRLFEAFYTTKSNGMGIGLSVSRSIIESHQGRLWASPNDGPGATFSFSIPHASRGVMDASSIGAIQPPALTEAERAGRKA
jgi:PAS domain S-box-containing protein